MAHKSAYVQGDWFASPNINKIGFESNPNLQKTYDEFLELLSKNNITNTATWHLEAKGIISGEGAKDKTTDVLRNTRQIAEADCVITYLIDEDPPKKHWGSLCLMGYALGLNKPCYLIADPKCVIWQSHFVWHPNIMKFNSVEEFLEHFV